MSMARDGASPPLAVLERPTELRLDVCCADRARYVLLARGRGQGRFFPLATAQINDLRRLPNLQHFERIRVVVDVGDRLSGDLDDHVALLQPGLFGRPA